MVKIISKLILAFIILFNFYSFSENTIQYKQSYHFLSPESFFSAVKWIFPNEPIDNIKFSEGENGIKDLINILQSVNADKIIHYPLKQKQLSLKFSHYKAPSGAHYLNIDIYPLRDVLRKYIQSIINDLVREVGDKSMLDEYSLGRITLLISNQNGNSVPLLWEVQPSASWRRMDSIYGGNNVFTIYPEWNWRKDVVQAISRFLIIYGFKDVYARSSESMQEHPNFSSEYVYYTSKINFQDFTDFEGFIEYLKSDKQSGYIKNKVEKTFCETLLNFPELKKRTFSTVTKKELRNLIVSSFNWMINDYKFIENNFVNIKEDGLLEKTEIQTQFNKLALILKIIDSATGKINKSYYLLTAKEKEELRWLNVKILEAVFSQFFNKPIPESQNKEKINKRDLKLNYFQVFSNEDNWAKPERVKYSIWYGSQTGNYREREFILHQYQKPDLRLKEIGLRFYSFIEVMKDTKKGRKSNLVIQYKTEDELLLWDFDYLLDKIGKDKIPEDRNNIEKITTWIRFIKGAKISDRIKLEDNTSIKPLKNAA